MWVWWRSRRVGVAAGRYLAAACCATIILGAAGRAAEPVLPAGLRHLPPIWESLYPARRLRDDVSAKLAKIPGKHLVFVHYSAGHCFCEEWVFNSADPESQRIVYVRPYTPESDEALARSMSYRDLWVVEPDAQPYRMMRTSSSVLALGIDRVYGDGMGEGLSSDLLDFFQHQVSGVVPCGVSNNCSGRGVALARSRPTHLPGNGTSLLPIRKRRAAGDRDGDRVSSGFTADPFAGLSHSAAKGTR